MPLLQFNAPVRQHYQLRTDGVEAELWKKLIRGKPTDELLYQYQVTIEELLDLGGYTPIDFDPDYSLTCIYFSLETRIGEVAVYEYVGRRYLCYPSLINPDSISFYS